LRSLPKTIYLAVDPGNDGGMSSLNSDGTLNRFDRIDGLSSMATFFAGEALHAGRINGVGGRRVVCVFEEYRGDQAAVAARSSGMYVGIVMLLCYTHGFELVRVAPQTWKAHHKLIVHQAKGQPKLSDTERYKAAKINSMAKFRQHFPDVNIVFPRCKVEHEGVAESMLIGLYAVEINL
jgi:hypothetical protein